VAHVLKHTVGKTTNRALINRRPAPTHIFRWKNQLPSICNCNCILTCQICVSTCYWLQNVILLYHEVVLGLIKCIYLSTVTDFTEHLRFRINFEISKFLQTFDRIFWRSTGPRPVRTLEQHSQAKASRQLSNEQDSIPWHVTNSCLILFNGRRQVVSVEPFPNHQYQIVWTN
jgi:hypothetical protein